MVFGSAADFAPSRSLVDPSEYVWPELLLIAHRPMGSVAK
jgi:hypothetical protein